MNVNYLKTLWRNSLVILLFCFGLTSVWGQTTVISQFSDFGFTNAETLPSGNLDGNISFTTEQNGSGTVPTYYTSGGIRFYPGGGNGGSITLHVEGDAIISSVKFFSSQTQPVVYSIDGGANLSLSASSTYEITGINASSTIKFINANANTSGSGNQLRLTGVEVTYTMATSCEPSDLTFANTEEIADLADGNTFTQTATSLNATTAITYESSDEAVATVDANGQVTLVSVGTAIITATQAAGEHNGEDYCAGTATYELTVITTEPLLTVFTNSASFSGFAGGAVATETITVEGFNLTGDIALALSGDTNFSINPTSLSSTGGAVTITYTPSATPATHSATLTVSNGSLSEVITLSGVTTEVPEIDCFEEDFSDITNGNSTSSTGSNTAWDGNSNFPTVTYAYQAGGKVRLGSSNNNGSITSVALTAFQGQSVTVSFDAKSWATSATSILVTLGTQSQVVELAEPAEWESDLTSYEIEFENVEANATLTFASNNNSARRFFLDNIAVCISEVSIDPILNVTSASITGLNYGLGSGPSVAQSFVLSGENLDGSDVTVTAPANFEVSTTEASGYASALTLTAYDGTETTIWVRLAAGQPVDTYAGNITISGGGAADATVAVSGAVLAVPVVTAETFNATVGESFSAQITATDNPTSYAYTGTLPAGLNFDTTTGAITGTPEVAGSSDIEVTATNIVGTSTPATVSIVVAQGVQTLVGFTDINTVLGAADIALPETTNAGLTVSYASSNTAVATVSGNTVSIVGLGTTTITATQAGNANWGAFSQDITLTVTEAPVLYGGVGVFEKVTSETDLTDGYYVVTNETGAFLMTNGRSGSDTAGFFVSADSDALSVYIVNPTAANVWKIETSGAGKTIYNEVSEKYVGWSSGNGASIEDAPADTNRWTFTYADNKFTVNNVAEPVRQLSYNATNPRFAAYGNANQQELQLFRLVESTTWNGTVWSNGEPNDTKVVVIEGAITVGASSGSVKSLIVTESGSITIPSGSSVTVDGVIVNAATAADFVVASGGALVQNQDVDNFGAITVNRNSNPMFRLDYTLWSSPVAMNLVDFSDVSATSPAGNGTLWNRVYTLGEAAWEQVWNSQPDFENDTTPFEAGQGYLYRSPNLWVTRDSGNPATAYEGIFNGVPNNGNITATTPYEFSSIGNPYPSPIDAEEFIANNDVEFIYFWTNTHAPVNGSYDNQPNNWAYFSAEAGGVSAAGGDLTPNGIIQPGQGFVAKMLSSSESVTFNNTMRTDDTSGLFFRQMATEKSRFWLNLSNEEVVFNQILVGYMDNATQGVDSGIDAKMFAYEGNALYSIIENSQENYVIQGRSLPFEASDVVALGFRAVNAGSFTISLHNFDGLFAEGNTTIYLKDNYTQTQHNLMSGAYSFISDEGMFDNRFEVVYQTTMNVENPVANNSNWVVYNQGEGYQIQTQGFELQNVTVFDLLGRTIYTSKAEGTVHQIPALGADSVYIVKVTTTDNVVLSKKVK